METFGLAATSTVSTAWAEMDLVEIGPDVEFLSQTWKGEECRETQQQWNRRRLCRGQWSWTVCVKGRVEQAVWLVSGCQPLVVKDVESYICPRLSNRVRDVYFINTSTVVFGSWEYEVGIKKAIQFHSFYRKLGLKDHTQKMCHFIMLPGHLNFFKCQIWFTLLVQFMCNKWTKLKEKNKYILI